MKMSICLKQFDPPARNFRTRRSLAAMLAAAWLATPPALADVSPESLDAARRHVQDTVSDIKAIPYPDGVGDGVAPETVAAFRDSLSEHADLALIARFVSGIHWRGMDDGARKRFRQAYTAWLVARYADRFRTYRDGDIRIGEVSEDRRDRATVQSTGTGGGRDPVDILWRVHSRSGGWLVYDIVIADVSLLITERETVGSLFETHRGDIDRVISDIESRLETKTGQSGAPS